MAWKIQNGIKYLFFSKRAVGNYRKFSIKSAPIFTFDTLTDKINKMNFLIGPVCLVQYDKMFRAAERMAQLCRSYLGTHQNFWHVAPNTSKADLEVINSRDGLPLHNDTTYFALPAGIMVKIEFHSSIYVQNSTDMDHLHNVRKPGSVIFVWNCISYFISNWI